MPIMGQSSQSCDGKDNNSVKDASLENLQSSLITGFISRQTNFLEVRK